MNGSDDAPESRKLIPINRDVNAQAAVHLKDHPAAHNWSSVMIFWLRVNGFDGCATIFFSLPLIELEKNDEADDAILILSISVIL